jgi:serine/threonine protein kinase
MVIIRKSIKKNKSKRHRNVHFLLKGVSRSSRNKYNKRGGGYIATLTINKPLLMILMTPSLNDDTSLIFTITNQTTQEIINYNNIRCLGQGTYGKVFLICNDGTNYVIKIGHNYPEDLIEEPKILDKIMSKVIPSCNYTAVSQGISHIEQHRVGHIIFPYKGGSNLYQITKDKSKIGVIPNVLRDVITCLIDINKYGCHGDLKLENIVYDEHTKTGFIIDFGLAAPFDMTISSLYNLNMGRRQISVDVIIGYLHENIKKDVSKLESLYLEHLDLIQKTIDNFGLFWVIVESISNVNIDTYIGSSHISQSRTPKIFSDYLNFYFNLDQNETSLTLELRKLFNYKSLPELHDDFIDDVYDEMTEEQYELYFDNDDELFTTFMKKVLSLINVDPTMRIPREVLLEDPFFHK